MSALRIVRRALPALAIGAALGLGVLKLGIPTSAAETAKSIPPPALDPPDPSPSARVVLAGGCFWGVQGVFQHVRGVTSAVSGYAGGEKGTAEYEIVSGGRTGHAESVRITYDPRTVSYGRLLQIYFSVAHDPTELNRQGPDVGTQYRSVIFPATKEQARIARAYIEIDAGDLVVRHRLLVTGIGAAGEDAAVDRGLQRLHPPVHDFGKAGVVAHLDHLQPSVPERLRRPAGGEYLDAVVSQCLAELHEAFLVGDGDQRPFDAGEIGGGRGGVALGGGHGRSFSPRPGGM
jgi:methionine-S-sulfoxide reductase